MGKKKRVEKAEHGAAYGMLFVALSIICFLVLLSGITALVYFIMS